MTLLIGKEAPDFTADACTPDGQLLEGFNLHQEIDQRYGVIFFYPMDFTFVCPTEILSLSSRAEIFKKLNCSVVGISVDSKWTHNAWRNTPPKMGGIGDISFTLISDLDRSISASYGVLAEDSRSYYPSGVSVRATFLTDKNRIVRHMVVNDEPLGRNMNELIRMIQALQFFEENGQVCPSGWNTGDTGMINTPAGVAEYLSTSSTNT
ncbi:MAG: peroxiredoxin [Proteobacteria bacterium]|nr:peroxiredoxin [Pseudomonadota bacterium]MBT4358324.1 peroxiredoxin [Pseudomonadota bacterium]MBT6657937.1 peroxiredoxin [Pseudomonadota bacterium]MBT7671478.1 peroxiredoxin [Pseudomonadota bacterium]